MISGPKVLIDAEGEAVPMLEFKKISSVLVAIRFSCNISRYGIKFKRLRLTYKRERRERPTEINERRRRRERRERAQIATGPKAAVSWWLKKTDSPTKIMVASLSQQYGVLRTGAGKGRS